MPVFYVFLIYIVAAVLPAVFLMNYIYKMDTYEKEPAGLLWSLVLSGVFAALASILLELGGQALLDFSPIDKNSKTYVILLAFLVVAAVEEGTKFFFLFRRTWRDPNFNYRFDGIVYSAFVSLGFAAFENIKYVFSYGLTVAFPRAFLAVPGHLGFAVVFGYFYGRAKYAADRGKRAGMLVNLAAGYCMAVLLHGFYDACSMIGTAFSTLLFVIFVVVMYIVIFRLIKRESWNNAPV